MLDFQLLAQKIYKSNLSTRHLLSQARLIDEKSRNSPAFDDPKYMPVYYRLGQELQPKKVLEIGFELGLKAACLLLGSQQTESYVGFQNKQEEYYALRLGRSNVKTVYDKSLDVTLGDLTDLEESIKSKSFDMAILGDRTLLDIRPWLNLIWNHVDEEGLIIVDYIEEKRRSEFLLFCSTKNREPFLLETRYGLAILKR